MIADVGAFALVLWAAFWPVVWCALDALGYSRVRWYRRLMGER